MNKHTYNLLLAALRSDPLTLDQAQAVRQFVHMAQEVEPERLLSRCQTAKLLNCHVNTVDNLVKRLVLPAVKNGRRVQFRKTDVVRCMQTGW
jgi:excisionase family DNA binding protein